MRNFSHACSTRFRRRRPSRCWANPPMKTYLSAFALGLTAVLAAAAPAPANYPPVPFGALRIEKGMTRTQVREVFGEPGAVLSANVWAFFNLRFLTTPAAAPCDAMVLAFNQDRVNEIRLCDSASVRVLIARLEKRRNEEARVASK